MTDKDKRKFLDNIIADADRLTQISGRLRDLPAPKIPSRSAPPTVGFDTGLRSPSLRSIFARA